MTELTTEQIEALRAFARSYGRQWKSKLRDLWAKGTASDGGAMSDSPLYRLRNTHGPSWLVAYRLPK